MNVWRPSRLGMVFLAGNPVKKEDTMLRTRYQVSLGLLIYLVIGVVVAWQRQYITVGLLKALLSAILAILLWFLVLLGVNLHLP